MITDSSKLSVFPQGKYHMGPFLILIIQLQQKFLTEPMQVLVNGSSRIKGGILLTQLIWLWATSTQQPGWNNSGNNIFWIFKQKEGFLVDESFFQVFWYEGCSFFTNWGHYMSTNCSSSRQLEACYQACQSWQRICHFTEKQTLNQICFQSGAETDRKDSTAAWISPSSHGWWERSTRGRSSHWADSSNIPVFHTVAVGSEDHWWCQCLLQCKPEQRHPEQTKIQPLKLQRRGNSPLFHLRAN